MLAKHRFVRAETEFIMNALKCNAIKKENETKIEKRNKKEKKIELITIPYLMMMYYVCEFKILTLNMMFMDMM